MYPAWCRTRGSMDCVNDYLLKYDMLKYVSLITKEKPPAIAYIDDRAICFDDHIETLLSKIEKFQTLEQMRVQHYERMQHYDALVEKWS